MKKLSVLAAFFVIFLAASAVFAQEQGDNFAGNWQLDAAKSKLSERMRVESMTMKVSQSDQDIKVETAVKRAARPEGENGGGNGGNVGMRQGGMGGGSGTVVYSLVEGSRKGTVIKPENALENPPAAMRGAALKRDGKLKLNSSRTMNTPMGEMTVTTEETWELVDGGKGLKITRVTETPRGAQTSEMYFTKTNSAEASKPQTTEDGQIPKTISGGVLNGKASKLVVPAYPAEARESKASGGVNVQVTVDEAGNVVSAKAVSGDSTLKAAAEEAARNSKFAPTTLSGVPVRVTGVIYYNFVP